ncbi:MAG: hypothetical protein ACYDBB_13790 [Armatimonadota bacterium]
MKHLHAFFGIMSLLGVVLLGGCAGVRSAMDTGLVLTSWVGKTPAEITAQWGTPALDLSGAELQANMQYCPSKTTKTGPISVTAPDASVVRVLVYKPQPGAILVSANGKKKFTVNTDPARQTEICYGIYADGNITTWNMRDNPLPSK